MVRMNFGESGYEEWMETFISIKELPSMREEKRCGREYFRLLMDGVMDEVNYVDWRSIQWTRTRRRIRKSQKESKKEG